jgi:IS1 family transposase
MGKRNQGTTAQLLEGLRHATAHSRFQITTDGFGPYHSAISATLHDRCDFTPLIKVYGAPQDGEKHYSPAEVQCVEVVPLMGRTDPERICTSIVERSNLSLRMGMRRFTRLTMRSVRNGRTTGPLSRFGTAGITSGAFINRFGLLPLWLPELAITSGVCANFWTRLERRKQVIAFHAPPGRPLYSDTPVSGAAVHLPVLPSWRIGTGPSTSRFIMTRRISTRSRDTGIETISSCC